MTTDGISLNLFNEKKMGPCDETDRKNETTVHVDL